ncbi:MAG: apolipoprotein N-acyltransferase [Rhodobacter sp.]|uniref:apolipoprotein N-acyltransferase n=1 Tax=Pararhodobacter sp. TaxID=2127056 RepID=UPI002CD2DCF8|nr:apolipoprotein N-acyltransferase [Pararhodobacter sp.]MCC0074586.1 apolipoprotein N-acyltransferase [Rhodobacter sp.]HPD92840.1 apolipoprotein N-acyltransferase [Pararhodobacter sp.]
MQAPRPAPRRRAALIRLGAAAAPGLLAAFGQAPWGLWPLTLLGLAGVALLAATATTARQAFGRVWLAGGVHFAVVLAWIVDPFLVDAARDGWMAPFALLLMAGGMGLFWALAAALAQQAARPGVRRVWAFALAMLAFEDLRGVLLTGFPWALSGHIWIGTPPDQIAALAGALGLSALTLGLSAALATGGLWAQRRAPRRAALGMGAAVLALLAAWGWGAARLATPLPAGPGLTLRLVQANVPQDQKWDPDLMDGFFRRHLALSAAPAETRPDLVIWPESAAPFYLDRPGNGLRMAAEAAGAPLVLGLDRRAPDARGIRRYYNALAVVDAQGEPVAVYDKHHLVPFGEYMPVLGAWAADRGWSGLAAQALAGYTPGPGPRVLDLGPAGRVLPLICYEAVFPRDLRTPERPDWILQLTNDAWFGTHIGPFQHFAQARLRAIETGLPLVRAANTGISAVVDARGRVAARLDLDTMGVLDAPLPGALPAPPYAALGDGPWHGLLLSGVLLLGLGAALRRRKAIDAPRTTG